LQTTISLTLFFLHHSLVYIYNPTAWNTMTTELAYATRTVTCTSVCFSLDMKTLRMLASHDRCIYENS